MQQGQDQSGPQPLAATHEVFNQSPVFADVNLFASDAALRDAVAREGVGSAVDGLSHLGALAGSAEVLDLGRQANENEPKLRRFDQKGFPSDTVEFHPAYHAMMALSFREGLHASTWEPMLAGKTPEAGAQVARGARLYMVSQAEAGHMCPITMTHASFATLRLDETLLVRLQPKLLSREYDPSFMPMERKTSVTIGMGMTEKQGGTDVRPILPRPPPSAATASMPSPGINGSCRRRCAMLFLFLRKRRKGCPVSCCRASAPMAASTPCVSSG
jgi:putative acyl-CoA dehydrogenase